MSKTLHAQERLVLAIGDIADEYIIEASPLEIGLVGRDEVRPVKMRPRRKLFIGLVAAVIALMMGLLTAMAVNEDFRNAVLTLLNLNMSMAEAQPGEDGDMLVIDVIDDEDYDEMMQTLYPEGVTDEQSVADGEQGHDIPGIENMEEARINFIMENFKAYSLDGTELSEVAVTPFDVSLESIMDGQHERLFFKVETDNDSFIYPSENWGGFVSASGKGVYLAYTDLGIWRIDPNTLEVSKISTDLFNGKSLFEVREAIGEANFFWTDGVRLSADGMYAAYRTTRDCVPGGETSVWSANLTTGEERQVITPNMNNDIIGLLSEKHIMVGALADTRIVDINSGAVVSVDFPELPNFSVKAASHGTVVYSSYTDGSSETTAFVSSVDLVTGELTTISEVKGYLDAEPQFSPSGGVVAIGYGTDPMIGVVDVMLVNLSNGEQTLLTDLITEEEQIDGMIRRFQWVSDDALIVNVQNGSGFQSYMITLGDI